MDHGCRGLGTSVGKGCEMKGEGGSDCEPARLWENEKKLVVRRKESEERDRDREIKEKERERNMGVRESVVLDRSRYHKETYRPIE